MHDYLKRGELVPDELTVEIVHEHLDKLINLGLYSPEKQFLLMDGIPRTLKQAEALDRYHDVRQLILLDVPDREVLIQRLQGRGRGDDADLEVLRNRMRVYDEQTKETLTHYSKIARINADQTKLEVLRDVLESLIPVLKSP